MTKIKFLVTLVTFCFLSHSCKSRNQRASASLTDTKKMTNIQNNDKMIEDRWNEGVKLLNAATLQKFQRPDDPLHIAYVTLTSQKPSNGINRTVLIVPGFSESHYKYAEIVVEFLENGFDVVVINLRGMGFSERYKEDPKIKPMPPKLYPQVVHVADASDYSKDIIFLVDTILKNKIRGDLYAFAHSTGGFAVAATLVAKPKMFKAVVLNSPLLGLKIGFLIAYFAIPSLIKFTRK